MRNDGAGSTEPLVVGGFDPIYFRDEERLDPRRISTGSDRAPDLRVPRQRPSRHRELGDARPITTSPATRRRSASHAMRTANRTASCRRCRRCRSPRPALAPHPAGDERPGVDRGARADLRQSGHHDAHRPRVVRPASARDHRSCGTRSSIATTTRPGSCSATSRRFRRERPTGPTPPTRSCSSPRATPTSCAPPGSR